MNILYIGAGFVGTCSAAVAADSGHHVLLYDIDERKITALRSGDRDTIESCLFEDGLGDLLVRHQERIAFTTDYSQVKKFLDHCDAIFLCLPTPEIGETGESDLQYYRAAAEELGAALAERNGGRQDHYVVVVNKSTVPIALIDETKTIFARHGVKQCGVVSNPEFLVEGKAVSGSMKPDRVVVGAESEPDFLVMRQLYQRFYDSPDVEYIEVNPFEAAAGKLLANFYLFNKLAICFDVIGRTCETFSAVKFENIRRILTTDARIGSWGFYDSLYAGGSCFIKDARSLAHQLQTAGQDPVLVNETYLANRRQLELFLARAKTEAKREWRGSKVAILGLAFKRDTNDIRNAPALEIIRHLSEQNVAELRLYDPVATALTKTVFLASEHIQYTSPEDAIRDADIIIIATDWPEFRGLAELILQAARPGALIMDGRRMLQHQYSELQEAGFDVVAVGSPFMPGKRI